MKHLKKLPVLLSLFITFLTITISWIRNISGIETIIRLIFQIPVFYVIGMILFNYIDKNMAHDQEPEIAINELNEIIDDINTEEQGSEGQDEGEFEPIDFTRVNL